MTKGERRKARKAARAAGEPLTEELAIPAHQRDNATDSGEFTESAAGDRGRERWVRYYDELNGAPENDGDR